MADESDRTRLSRGAVRVDGEGAGRSSCVRVDGGGEDGNAEALGGSIVVDFDRRRLVVTRSRGSSPLNRDSSLMRSTNASQSASTMKQLYSAESQPAKSQN